MPPPTPGRSAAITLEAIYDSVGKLQANIRLAREGKIPKKLLFQQIRSEIFRQARAAQLAAWPEAKGPTSARVPCRILYKQRDGFIVPMEWDVQVSDGVDYKTILGFCPECYRLAPTHVDWRQGSQPAVHGGVMGLHRGNPAADRKLRVWSWSGPDVMFEWDRFGRPLLTCGSVLHCAHVAECGWAVRLERGRARWVPYRTIRSPNRAIGSKGPIMLDVSAAPTPTGAIVLVSK